MASTQRPLLIRFVRAAQSLLPLTTPMVVLLGFVLLLASGFDGFGLGLGPYRAVPIYAFLSLLLLLFQAVLWEKGSVGHILFVLGIGVLAIVFAGILVFSKSQPPVASPLIYYIANAVLFAVFLVDAYRRRHARQRGAVSPAAAAVLGGSQPLTDEQPPTRKLYDFFALLAADFIGLGILAAMFSVTIYQLEHSLPVFQPVLNAGPVLPSGRHGVPGIGHVQVSVPLLSITELWQLDRLLAFIAAFGAVVCIITVAWLIRDELETPEQVARILGEALTQVQLSIRPLGFFFWLIASLVIALAAQGTSHYFANLASQPPIPIIGLFDPTRNFDPLGLLESLIAAAAAVICVTVAAFFTEHDVAIIPRTLGMLAAAGRRLALTIWLFIVGLAFANAIGILLFGNIPEPFQVGAAGLATFVIAIIVFVAYAFIDRQRKDKKRQIHNGSLSTEEQAH